MTKKITAAELSEIVVKMLAGQGGEVDTRMHGDQKDLKMKCCCRAVI